MSRNRLRRSETASSEGKNGPLERFDPAGACLPAVNSLCSGEERVYPVAAEGPNRKFRLREDRQGLTVTLSKIVTGEGEDLPRPVQPFPKEYEIKIEPAPLHEKIWEGIKDNWQWPWTAVVIPFMPWLWRRAGTLLKGAGPTD